MSYPSHYRKLGLEDLRRGDILVLKSGAEAVFVEYCPDGRLWALLDGEGRALWKADGTKCFPDSWPQNYAIAAVRRIASATTT